MAQLRSEMKKRFLTGIVIVLLTVLFFALRFVSIYIFDIYLMAILFASTYEVAKVFYSNKKIVDYHIVLPFGVLSYIALILAMAKKIDILLLYGMLLSIMVILFVVSLTLNLLMKNRMNKEMIDTNFVGSKQKYAFKKSLYNLFVMFYPAFILFQLVVLNHLSNLSNFAGLAGKNFELLLLLILFVTTMTTDTGAYLVGSSLKGPKLCPKISPNKTISGAVGGVILSITVSILIFFLFSAIGFADVLSTCGLTIWHFLIYGLLASIATQVGDILASLLKRKNGVKDFGTVLAGHGGFMDRVDGLSLNACITLIFAIILLI